jgi:hypothetical protein
MVDPSDRLTKGAKEKQEIFFANESFSLSTIKICKENLQQNQTQAKLI